ncbi:MAG: imidazolonepropionase [Cytophagales bacterium]|nr:imidazolonepropionase [Cytophagales bacterium]
MPRYRLLGPIDQVVTMTGMPLKGPLADEQLPVLKQGGVLLEDEKIHSVGKYADLLGRANKVKAQRVELERPTVCLPGWIDAHTHICFHGSRAKDYALRNAGASYQQIAREGGGIWDTVGHTRQASEHDLGEGILLRAQALLKNGVTTIEVKSGYGLTLEDELKMLRAIKVADRQAAQDLVSTCLAAHILPKDYDGDHAAYLAEMAGELLPRAKSEALTNRVDAFVEEGAFSESIIAPYFQKARSMGFQLTVHADQFTTGGTAVAVDHHAVSADHLETSTAKEITLLSQSEVIAVALPGASIGLGCGFAPARKLLDAGCALAIASDWNPGSAPMGDLLVQASVLATFEKLTNAEVLAGISFRAAAALGLQDRGHLSPGALGDLNLYATDHFREISYHQGMLKPYQVWKRGEKVFSVDE